jgi:hypothetical protein
MNFSTLLYKTLHVTKLTLDLPAETQKKKIEILNRLLNSKVIDTNIIVTVKEINNGK